MRTPAESSLALRVLLLSLATLCGCFTPFEVECFEDAHCNRFPGGLCHTNPQTERRWCSYPDAACSTGYRYSDLDVGDGVSATCTNEPPARCDPNADFGEPTLVPNINSSFNEIGMSMTPDELTAYITREGGYSTPLITSVRRAIADDFPPPTIDPSLVAVISATGVEYSPSLTADGLLLYFQRYLSGEVPRIFVAARATQADVFDEGLPIFSGSTAGAAALFPAISSDGQTLYWLDYYDSKLQAATRQYGYRSFSEQMLKSTAELFYRTLSADELALYYSNGLKTADIFVAKRDSKTIAFETGALVPNVNSIEPDLPLLLTVDGCLLYLSSARAGGLGGNDIWVARRAR